MQIHKTVTVRLLIAAFAVALVAGVVAFMFYAPTTAPAGASSTAEDAAVETDFEYPVNEQGQTYGSLADAPSDDQAPDLVLVELPNGEEAYVKSEDLFAAEGENASTPAEAKAFEKKLEKSGGIDLPAFESDGKTSAGTFEGVNPTAEEE